MDSHLNKDIFTETGCISRTKLLGYRNRSLRRSDLHDVEKHLVDCALCSEALEGLELMKNDVALEHLSKKLKSEFSSHTERSALPTYFKLAAAITALVILTYVAFLQTEKTAENNQAYLESPVSPQISTPPAINQKVVENTFPSKKEFQKENGAVKNKKPEASNMKVQSNQSGDHSSVYETNVIEEGMARSDMNASADSEMPVFLESPSESEGASIANTSPGALIEQKSGYMKNTAFIDDLQVINYENLKTKSIDKTSAKELASDREKIKAQSENNHSSASTTSSDKNYLENIKAPLKYYKQKKYEQAISGFDALLSLNPEDENANFYKGLSLFHLNRFDESLQLLLPIGGGITQPFSQEAYFYVGRCYEEKGNKQQALEIYRKIISERGIYKDKASRRIREMR
jgi:tetratricopeptide (TPR) repeat protein